MRQLTLWDEAGSKVIKGNLIEVPIQNSLIYLQPIQSANMPFPAFQRIVVASTTDVVWDSTLSGALTKLLATRPARRPRRARARRPEREQRTEQRTNPTATATATPGAGATPPAGNVAALIAYANQHFELARR